MKIVVFSPRQDEAVRGFSDEFGEVNWAFAATAEEAATSLEGADALLTSNQFCIDLGRALQGRPHAAARLGWIHFLSAGYENAPKSGLPPYRVATNSAGVKARTVGEHAVSLLLALVKDFPSYAAHQKEHRWSRADRRITTLENKVVCIIGVGAIAREIARKLEPFDVHLIAVSRASEPTAPFEQMFSRERLSEALALADATIIATNADPSNHHMFNGAAFDAMKASAYIVNIARGSFIDEAALVDALEARKIAGAGVDVTDAEPLPPTSLLWSQPNIIITPHVAGLGSLSVGEHRALFAANLQRFKAGESMVNEVDLYA